MSSSPLRLLRTILCADSTLAGRAGETIELAQAALFFASDESSYITGTILPVDGGLHDTGVYGLMRKKMSEIQEKKG
jgi:NAD(P)-dependent dehydrogenase (short-subunit alcohol dehydrogenase family)